MKKKILIMHATYGAGHKKAAEYVASAFNDSKYEVKLLDINDYTNWIGTTGKKLFDMNVTKGSGWIFSLVYKFFDNKINSSPYRGITLNIYKKKHLYNEIIKFNPDLVISTHFFCNAFVAEVKKKYGFSPKIMTIITDFTSHELWTKNHKDIYAFIAANDIVKNMLIKSGVDEKKIHVFGIPFVKDFSILDEDEKTYEKYGIDKSKGYILFLGGSNGSMNSFKFFRHVANKLQNKEIIFVSGRNEKLRERCLEYKNSINRNDIKVLGFTTDMLNLMKASDFVITKPGGLVVIECMELKKPMILIPGAGGPETENAKYLRNKGVALSCSLPFRLMSKIRKLSNLHLRNKYIRNLEKVEKNNSVPEIFKLCKKILNEK